MFSTEHQNGGLGGNKYWTSCDQTTLCGSPQLFQGNKAPSLGTVRPAISGLHVCKPTLHLSTEGSSYIPILI